MSAPAKHSFEQYSQVQFIGYAISTVPKVHVENGTRPGINKYYLGLADTRADIEARLALLSTALHEAQQAFNPAKGVLRVFVIPEFFFRGIKGAYLSEHEPFLAVRLQAILQAQAPGVDLAVFGTSLFCANPVDYTHPITAKNYALGDDFLNVYRACRDFRESVGLNTPSMQEMLFYLDELEAMDNITSLDSLASVSQTTTSLPPLSAVLQELLAACDQEAPLVVSNQSQIFLGGQRYLSVQKQFKSKVDFVLNYYRDSAHSLENLDAYLQTFVKYPLIPDSSTETKADDLDPYGIFNWGGMKIGVEICLDHIRRRMSKKVDDLDLQIIPSCGVEITLNGIATRPGGYIFNCDGDYNLEDAQNGPGSHTQLYRVERCERGKSLVHGTNFSLGLTPGQGAKLSARISPEHVIAINHAGADNLFSFGAGELHVYPSLELPKKN